MFLFFENRNGAIRRAWENTVRCDSQHNEDTTHTIINNTVIRRIQLNCQSWMPPLNSLAHQFDLDSFSHANSTTIIVLSLWHYFYKKRFSVLWICTFLLNHHNSKSSYLETVVQYNNSSVPVKCLFLPCLSLYYYDYHYNILPCD